MLNFTTLLPFASGQLPRQRCGSAISAGRVWLFRPNSEACARGLPRYCGAGEKESKRHFLEGGAQEGVCRPEGGAAPSQEGRGRSAARRERPVPDTVFPGVLAGRTLESGGLFRRLHVREASAVGLGERQAHSEERGRLPALWGRPCQEPGRQGGVSRAHKDHHTCWSV